MDSDTDVIKQEIYVQFPKKRRMIFGIPIATYFFLIGTAFAGFGGELLFAIIPLYMRGELHFTELETKEIFHLQSSLSIALKMFGAIMADNWFGYYYPVIVGVVVLCVSKLVFATSSIKRIGLPMRAFLFIYYALITFGSAILGSCYGSLEGDQFILPEETASLTAYYYILYFSYNIISLLSNVVSPLMRANINCFGNTSCYPLPFFLGSIFYVLFTISFIAGKRYYIIKKPKKNILVKFASCTFYALRQRFKRNRTERKPHWLDYAADKYGEHFVEKCKVVYRIIVVFAPLPFFDALYSQQYTSWLFTASKMDGNVGFMTILPDQFHSINPVIVLIFVPIIKTYVLPFFKRKNIFTKSLEQIGLGVFLTAVSFFVIAFLQFRVEAENPQKPGKGEAQIRIYNSLPCDVHVTSDVFSTAIPGLDVYTNKTLQVTNEVKISYEVSVSETCVQKIDSKQDQFSVSEEKLVGIYIGWNSTGLITFQFKDDVDKNKEGLPLVRHFVTAEKTDQLQIEYYDRGNIKRGNSSATSLDFIEELKPNAFSVKIDDNIIGEIDVRSGGVYAVLISYLNPAEPKYNMVIITPANIFHMLWMTVPYVIMTIGEVFTAVPEWEFSYTQAPRGMKACTQSIIRLKTSIGNLLVVIIDQLSVVGSQAVLYIIWAVLMLICLGIFAFIAKRYKYVDIMEEVDEQIIDKKETEKHK